MELEYPPSNDVRTYESSFEAAHSEARQKGFNGSLVLRSDDGEGVIVYLDGYPIYSYYTNSDTKHAKEAMEYIIQQRGEIDRHESEDETV
ncbi:MAG: hypothetical protein SXQ77_06465, partial [Halobacteria archaeon]|nr:hypothetical protein [Halobacteria archaeon]